MAKIAMLLAVVLAVTGLVVPPVEGGDATYSPKVVLGPLAFLTDEGGNLSCFEVFAREKAPGQFQLYGEAKRINNTAVAQAVMGHAIVAGANVIWGLEVFPTAAVAVALKLGGIFALSTLLGNGSGFFLFDSGVFPYSFLFLLVAASCADVFAGPA